MTRGTDEFDDIARLFRPLTGGSPEALDLLDDAAVLSPPQGMDLVVTMDAVVEGVHFLGGDPLDLVARKLLRVNLSDLAAKAAEPYAYLLAVSWSPRCGPAERAAFAAGLAQDQREFGIRLIGGDTTSTPGPLTASLTAFGLVPAGRMVARAGARAGDMLLVSGTIGDGGLGLRAARGEFHSAAADGAALIDRYRLPRPRLALREALRAHASAAADVSDGLLADAGHIATASGCAAKIDLQRAPLSAAAAEWLRWQPDRAAALIDLTTAGDDYEIVCAAPPEAVQPLVAAAAAAGTSLTEIGGFDEGQGVRALLDGAPVDVARTGWRHP